jgi:uncharacterized protein YdbL (DUF1318 family)
MSRRVFLGAVASVSLVLSGCQGMDPGKLGINMQIQTASQATPDEARQVVSLIYAQAPDSALEALPFVFGDYLTFTEQIKARLPQLRPWFDQGVIGNTSGGYVAVRDRSRAAEVRPLVKAENNDRTNLYGASANPVAQVDDDDASNASSEQAAYGAAWIDLAPSGWWFKDSTGNWRQKGG